MQQKNGRLIGMLCIRAAISYLRTCSVDPMKLGT